MVTYGYGYENIFTRTYLQVKFWCSTLPVARLRVGVSLKCEEAPWEPSMVPVRGSFALFLESQELFPFLSFHPLPYLKSHMVEPGVVAA